MRLAERTVEPRLSGGFAWAPLRARVRGDAPAIDTALAEAALDVMQNSGPGASASHAVALAELLYNAPRKAGVALEALAATTRDAAIWSDLGAARYTVAASEGPEELFPALAATDTALRIDGELPEARFNRALIVERLGFRDPAITAWKSFLEVDTASEWAVEARTHLNRLSASTTSPDFSERQVARLVASPDETRSLVRSFPQESRLAAEREILARWGGAVNRGDEVAAEREFTLASIIGSELFRRSGDRMVERAVTAIREATGARRLALATGHIDFTSALKTFRSGRSSEAEPVFRRAAGELQRAGSPFAFTALFFAGYSRYEEGSVAESTRELQDLISRIPAEFLTCRATVQWQLSICLSAEGRWGEDIDSAKASLAAFVRAGEEGNAAMMRDELAESHDLIGDDQTAWKYRVTALPVLGRTSNRFLQAILSFLSQSAVFRQEWPLADSFTELELEVGKTARYEPGLADAHLRRALIRHHLGYLDPSEDIARARSITAAIPDAGMRSRLDARRVAVEAMVARTPAEAVPLLTAAIDFQRSSRGQRMYLPALYFYRARAHRASAQLASARRDLDAALAEFDAGRGSLDSPDQRLGVFESASGVIDEAIDLALVQNDAAGAFAYAEHARARTLLEQIQPPASSAAMPRIPAGTAVIEYAVLPSRLVIFVLKGAQISVASRAADRGALAARVSTFSEALERNADGRSEGQGLYRDLITPIEPWIAVDDELVIVPDATTTPLAFAALTAPDGRLLVEKHVLLSAPSAAVFTQTSANRAAAVPNQRLLMVISDNPGDQGLSALPTVAEEGRRVASSYRDVRLLAGPAASRAAFVREAAGAGVIHFAGHALSSEYRPEKTSIVLAGPDGRMSIRDIARLPLKGCSTVVLAACGTARGKTWRFEGTLSVARAFLAAGSPSVIATLWPIDDAEAAIFFSRVHEGLARGLSPANALRAAQIQALRETRSPALWAAVQAIGAE